MARADASAAGLIRFEFPLKPIEPLSGAALVGVGLQFARRHQFLVPCEQPAHKGAATLSERGRIFRTMPEKDATR